MPKSGRRLKICSSGTIDTSLWEATIENGLHPNLAAELSEIYAWTVDFFGLQKGDRFKVIYEELSIEDKSLGIRVIYMEHSSIQSGLQLQQFHLYRTVQQVILIQPRTKPEKSFSESSSKVFQDQFPLFMERGFILYLEYEGHISVSIMLPR